MLVCFFFQAEDGIRDLVRSRGLGDVYKRQHPDIDLVLEEREASAILPALDNHQYDLAFVRDNYCLLYTSDAADERSSVDLGGRRIIKKKKKTKDWVRRRSK